MENNHEDYLNIINEKYPIFKRIQIAILSDNHNELIILTKNSK